MNGNKLVALLRKYKKCPKCEASWRGDSIKSELKNEVVHIYCNCGWHKYVDENNKEVKEQDLN